MLLQRAYNLHATFGAGYMLQASYLREAWVGPPPAFGFVWRGTLAKTYPALALLKL